MQKMEKILVPIDFSETSAAALRDALSLVGNTKTRIVALHVIDLSAEGDFLVSWFTPVEGFPIELNASRSVPIDVLRRERSLDLWNFVDRTAGSTRCDAITKVIRIGRLAEAMASVVREEHIDMLAVNLRKRFLSPDLAALKLLKIARRLSCPVLVGPPSMAGGNGVRARRFEFETASN